MKLKLSRQVKWMFILLTISIASMVIHNFGDYFFGPWVGVPFFFLTLIALAGLVGLSIYVAYSYARFRRPKDAWMVGFIGLAFLVFMLVVGFNKYAPFVVPAYFLLFFLFRAWR